MKRGNFRIALLSASALSITAGAPALAQQAPTALEEIVVTAQKREQRLQDVPVAVTAVTEDALVANRIVNVRDLDGLTPGLSVRQQSGGNALSSFSMRGILTSGDAPGRDRGIALYIDGVYIGNAFGTMMSMPDVERIEVLRGPQGTLFGRNSTGGAISVTTKEPDGEFRFKQTFSLGNLDYARSATSVSSPQVGPFSFLGSFVYSREGGDMRNLGGGTQWDFSRLFGHRVVRTSPKRLGGNESKSAFAAVKGDFGDLDLVYRFDYTSGDVSPPGQGIAYLSPAMRAVVAAQPSQALMTPVTGGRPGAVNNAATVESDIKVQGHSLTATWQVSDAVQLKNVAAYRRTEIEAMSADVSGLGGLVNTGGAFLSARIRPTQAAALIGAPLLITTTAQDNLFKQWSDELQININTDPFVLTAGALFFEQKAYFGGIGIENDIGRLRNGNYVVLPNFTFPPSPPFANPSMLGGRQTYVKTRSYAVYGQGEAHVMDNLDLVAGVRYTKDRKTGVDRGIRSAANPNEFRIDYSADKITYLLGVNYKPTQDMLLYGKYSTAFISGGVSSTVPYDPETAKSWEAGIKADWLEGRLRTNLALYTVDYGNITANPLTSAIPAYAPLAALGVGTVTTNVGAARAKGFELETTFAPSRPFLFAANVGYMEFKYKSLSPVVTQGSLEYQAVNRPKWTTALSGQYTSPEFSNGVYATARLDATWRSRQHGTASIPLPGNANAGGAAFTLAEVAAYKAATETAPYWIVNGRLALNDIPVGKLQGTFALWGRNLFNDKSSPFPIGFISHVTAMYERARTVGVDLSVEF